LDECINLMSLAKFQVAKKHVGWQAQLDLELSYRDRKTVLTHRSQRGPLSVQRAFYPEGDVCHLYVLHPPGGVVGGDIITINTDVKKNAHALLTTPGATKFYRSQGETAYQQQNLCVDKLGSLEWLPQENIYFPGAKARMTTQIKLADSARFIGWETHCFGLPATNERFTTGQMDLDFALFKDGRPLLMERIKIMEDRLDAPTGLRGNAVMATLIASPADSGALETVRHILSKDYKPIIAATLIEDCLLVRYLGNSTAECRILFSRLWDTLRPIILKREACPPRIWAT
jgi:urease accessory protein